MNRNTKRRSPAVDLLGLFSFGFFILLIGAIWLSTPSPPGLTEEVIRFGKDFQLQNITDNVVFPAPRNLYSHTVLFNAALQFCIIFGIFEIVLLTLRLALNDSIEKKASNVSGIVFWFSASYFLNWLVESSLQKSGLSWLGFLAGIIVSVGLAIVASSLVRLLT